MQVSLCSNWGCAMAGRHWEELSCLLLVLFHWQSFASWEDKASDYFVVEERSLCSNLGPKHTCSSGYIWDLSLEMEFSQCFLMGSCVLPRCCKCSSWASFILVRLGCRLPRSCQCSVWCFERSTRSLADLSLTLDKPEEGTPCGMVPLWTFCS